mmetsp:Transcript_29228/g.61527  ORF Transcript_29228/g.61527 Transcript_29228/m.61527 type:complete len:82 (+) Transcript_29228:1566-1811(+)
MILGLDETNAFETRISLLKSPLWIRVEEDMDDIRTRAHQLSTIGQQGDKGRFFSQNFDQTRRMKKSVLYLQESRQQADTKG